MIVINIPGSYQLFGGLRHECILLHCFDFQASLLQAVVDLEVLFDILSVKKIKNIKLYHIISLLL